MAINSPRQILKEQYNQRGQIIIDDAHLLGSLLRALCGAAIREIAALLNAQNALVPSALKISTGIPHTLLINKITRQLQAHENMEDVAARWAVETWAYALGIINSSECTTPETFSLSINPPPAPQPGSPTVIKRYENWKHALFDFSRRNPLLYYKPTQASSLEIVRPDIYSLFDRMVIKGKPLSFPQYRVESISPEPGAPSGTRFPDRYILEKKGEIECDKQAGDLVHALGNIRNLARASRTESGLNSLYLSFGMLRWNEYNSSEDNYAPLILVPADIVIKESRDSFYLSFFNDDIVLNPTLSAFLNDLQYGYYFKLPDFKDDLSIPLQDYLANVNKLVSARMWHVEPKAVLRLFSFQTIRMGMDMDQADEINLYPPVIKLLSHEPIEPLPTQTHQEYSDLDDQLRPEDFFQVLEADASQVAALALARCGDHMVWHGPPGTGKSSNHRKFDCPGSR